MTKSQGIGSKINRTYLLQAILILIATIAGVYLAKFAIEEVLIKNAIQEEQDYFWEKYKHDSDFSLPNTKNLNGYFSHQALPASIRNSLPDQLGTYEAGSGEDRVVVQISQQEQKKLYLVYYRGQVDALILYYGIAPLFVVLVILYLSLWVAYRLNRRTISPFLDLARKIDQIDLSNPDFSNLKTDNHVFSPNSEYQVLCEAIIDLGKRLTDFVERERNFTRDASHELRTPLTVINVAADMLLSEQDISDEVRDSVQKIRNATSDIRKLTEIFLLLAREEDQALNKDVISLVQIISDEVRTASVLMGEKDVTINFAPKFDLEIWSSDVVVSVIIRNLLHNAIRYTQKGSIFILVTDQSIVVEDSGEGISEQELNAVFEPFHRSSSKNISGYGIGLTIVKRLASRFNWPIDVDSKLGKGTRFEIHFPEALKLERK
ncbi:MAG: HAMP domain-containing sensor histidine kinase [Pseudomonadota bacterium]